MYTTRLVICTALIFYFFTGSNCAQKLPCEKLAGFSYSSDDDSVGYFQNPTISSDGNRLIFLRLLPGKKVDIEYFYESIKEGEVWSEPEPLQMINNAKGDLTFGSRVAFSPDGNTIFFHGTLQGGFGENDIYISHFQNGLWQPPINLGPPINSDKNEFEAWIDEDNTLYFTRAYQVGKDIEAKIYYSKVDRDGNWSDPERWYPELDFHHTESPVVFRENAILFYATNKNESSHQHYLSVKSIENTWSVPVLIEFECATNAAISTTQDFEYFYLDDGWGNLTQARVPEYLRTMVNSNDTKIASHQTFEEETDQGKQVFEARSMPNGNRYALVIGNSQYPEAALLNPVNDANSMAAELQKAGFEVIKYTDTSLAEMREAIREFGDMVYHNEGVGLFYYAGHGIQSEGINYLVPVDAEIERVYDIEDQCLKADLVLRMLERYQNPMNIIILDACRNNPYTRSFRSLNRGLAQPESAPVGSIIAFATAPGKTASDGDGENGLYTQELIKAIQIPGLTIEEVFKQVRIHVIQLSNGDQIPWENLSLTGDFFFYPEEK